jgi:hypothetical protein
MLRRTARAGRAGVHEGKDRRDEQQGLHVAQCHTRSGAVFDFGQRRGERCAGFLQRLCHPHRIRGALVNWKKAACGAFFGQQLRSRRQKASPGLFTKGPPATARSYAGPQVQRAAGGDENAEMTETPACRGFTGAGHATSRISEECRVCACVGSRCRGSRSGERHIAGAGEPRAEH